eukprot:SAG31_NODE_1445_length_8320_cov_3.454081_7_plen_109_part_00
MDWALSRFKQILRDYRLLPLSKISNFCAAVTFAWLYPARIAVLTVCGQIHNLPTRPSAVTCLLLHLGGQLQTSGLERYFEIWTMTAYKFLCALICKRMLEGATFSPGS